MQQTSFLSRLYEIKPFKIVDSPQNMKNERKSTRQNEQFLPLSLISLQKYEQITKQYNIPLKTLQNNTINNDDRVSNNKKLFSYNYENKQKQNIIINKSIPYLLKDSNINIFNQNQFSSINQSINNYQQKNNQFSINNMIESQVYNNLSSSIDTLFSKIQKIKQEFQQNSTSINVNINEDNKNKEVKTKFKIFKQQTKKQLSEYSPIKNHFKGSESIQNQLHEINPIIPFTKSISFVPLPKLETHQKQKQTLSNKFSEIQSIQFIQNDKISIDHIQNIQQMSNKTRSIINQINLLLENSKKNTSKPNSPKVFQKYGNQNKVYHHIHFPKNQQHIHSSYQYTQENQQHLQEYDQFYDEFKPPKLKTTQTQYVPNEKNKSNVSNTTKNYGVRNEICLSSARLGFKIQQPVYQISPSPNKKQQKVNRNTQNYQDSYLYKQEIKGKKVEVLTMKNFQLGKCVGSGKFGDVHICRHKTTGTLYALKKIFKSTIIEYGMIEQFTRELKIHYKLSNTHPNITKLYAHFEDEYHLFLLMEYMEDGTLMQHLKKSQQFVSSIVEQVLNAVEYLHRSNIAHRDIKPENILLTNGVIKLCDFGWSSHFNDEMKRTFCGTLDYVSPEMKDKGQYNTSVDLWSIGVLTFQLLVGFPPYKKEIDKWKIMGGKIKDKWKWDVIYPPNMSDCAQDFISKILKQNPDDRASIRQCRNHEFIWKYCNKNPISILQKQEQHIIEE